MSFKCFNCGKVGNFAAKSPYSKKDSEDEDDKNKQYWKKGKYHYMKKITKEKIISTQKKKTTVHLSLVTVMMKSFY